MADFQLQFSQTGGVELNKRIDAITQALKEAEKAAGNASKDIQDFGDSAGDAAKGASNLSASLASFAGNLAANAISTLTGQLMSFVQASFQAGAQFETFGAVIENTVGSAAVAESELNRITQFAATTPFQIQELVDAFIKLSNRGIKPTNEVLTQFGDIALSQGKSLDQFIEAVLDATTGEFERLKEFGIRASKDGDNVALTFKGITKEVALTEEAIAGALSGFAGLDGVAGSIGSVASTTEGKVSNLEDSLTQLQVLIFNELQPAFNEAMGTLSELIAEATTEGSDLNQTLSAILETSSNVAGVVSSAINTIGGELQPVVSILSTALQGLNLIPQFIDEISTKFSGLLPFLDKLESIPSPVGLLAQGLEGVGAAVAGATGSTKELSEQLDLAKSVSQAYASEAASLSEKLKNATDEELDSYVDLADGLASSVDQQIDSLREKLKVVQDPALKKEYEEEIASLEEVKIAIGENAGAALDASNEKAKAAESARVEAKKQQEIEAKEAEKLAKEKAKAEEQAAKEAAKALEQAEKEAARAQDALREANFQKEKTRIELQTAIAVQAIDDRVSAEEAVIESINDQTDALNNQLEILGLLGEEAQLRSDARLQALDREQSGLDRAVGLIGLLNDKEATREQKAIALNELRELGISKDITVGELQEKQLEIAEKRRQEEARRLAETQALERQQLDIQIALEEASLRRAVQEAKINDLKAQQAILDAQAIVNQQKLEELNAAAELATAQARGASQAEIIALQSKLELLQAGLGLSEQQITNAQEAAELAKGEVEDTQNALDGYAQIAEQRRENLAISQELAQSNLENNQELERTDEELSQAGQSASDLRQKVSSTFEPIPRRSGGPVSPGNLYQVNEAGLESFKPAGSNSLIPLLQPSNSLFSPSVPGTILNASQTSGAIANAGLLAEIRGLRADLARRPVPVLNAPANFTNAPSPLATQIQWLQGTMKAMRGAI